MVGLRSSAVLVLAATLAAVVTLGPVVAQPPPPGPGPATGGPGVNRAFTEGVSLINEQRYDEAVAPLRQATTEEPDLEPAWFYLGIALFPRLPDYQGDPQGALEAFQRSVELAPFRRDSHYYLGQLYEQAGDPVAAVEAYVSEIKIRRGKDIGEVLNALGRVYMDLGRLKEADEAFSSAIASEPNYAEAYYHRCRARDALGEPKLAIKDALRAKEMIEEWEAERDKTRLLTEGGRRDVEITPERVAQRYRLVEEFVTGKKLRPALNVALGQAYDHDVQYSLARQAYRQALSPVEGGTGTDPWPQTLIAHSYFHEGRDSLLEDGLIGMASGVLDAAITQFGTVLGSVPDYPPALNGLGTVYAFQASSYQTDVERGIVSHTYADAVAQFEAALAADPTYVDALVNLGLALNGAGDYMLARERLEQAVQLAPGRGDAFAGLAESYVGLGMYPEAIQAGERALALEPGSYKANTCIGLAHYYQGNIPLAIAHFQRAIRADPRQHEAYTNLGNAYFQSQSWHLARVNYREALDRLPDVLVTGIIAQRAYLQFLIGLSYSNAGSHDQAVRSYNEALALDGNYLDALRQLGRSYTALRQYRAAEEALRDALNKSPSQAVDAQIHAQLGQVFETEGRNHEAIAEYSTALNIDPTNQDALEGLQRLTS